ncbi:MAG: hypothetical protein II037_09090 [Bacteroidales bacterium]|nr:hypothetical protein [Bacteroidales bacterium]
MSYHFSMTLKEIIEENIDEVYAVETFMNKKNIADIEDDDTTRIGYTKDKRPECQRDFENLNETLLNSEPLVAYLFNNIEYIKYVTKNMIGAGVPEDKKILIAVYSGDIYKKDEIE